MQVDFSGNMIYKVQPEKPSPSKCILCRVSAKNIVAFCILQDESSTSEYANDIFTCDIVSPWQVFKVHTTRNTITVLEWSLSGEFLLVGYENGIIEVWSTEKVLNSWFLQYTVNFPSEYILAAKFFHSGKCLLFHTQKKDSPIYSEKFERLKYKPTLECFGNAANEGALILTASGLLGAFIIPNIRDDNSNNQSVELSASTHSIDLSRCYILFCSLSHCPNGSINVAVNYNSKREIVYCFRVALKAENEESIAMKCESLPSIFLGPRKYETISHIKWLSPCKEDIIYVAYNSADGSLFEQWDLTKKHQSVHKLLQKSKTDLVCSEAWENMSKLRFPVEIADVCVPRLLQDAYQIFVILKDNTVRMLDVGLRDVGLVIFERPTLEDVQQKCKFVSGDFTPMNQILFIFDNYGQLYAVQASNLYNDKCYNMNTALLQVSLLEYSIVTGIDATDIILLNLNNLDMLIEKLTDNFTRQPAFIRHFYYSNFLSLKSNLCRVQSRQQDFDDLIMLHSISITFKSLLRPADLSCQDKGPAENLSIIISDPQSDVDKLMCNLDAKDFTIEPLTLQSLQQLIQWVSDLALHILNKLPDEVIKSKLNKKHGYDISRDMVAIGSIRELLIMIRIWGLLNSQCLPVYTKSVDNVDVLSILFKLLTRLAHNTAEPDESLLDECSTLSTQVLVPQKSFNIPTTLLNLHVTAFTFNFTMTVKPTGMQEIQAQEVVFATGVKDSVSNLQLGCKASAYRKCVRCGFVNSLRNVAKTIPLKAWCQRWLYCHCGGYWKTLNKI